LFFSFVFSGTFIPSLVNEQYDYLSTELTPSESEPCHCCSCFLRRRKDRKKFTVRRMPGKIAHLVPMQRFDSVMIKRQISMVKPSSIDHQRYASNRLPPTTTTTSPPLALKASLDDPSIGGWSSAGPPPFSSASSCHLPLHPSTSIHSLKPTADQQTNVNKRENRISQTKLQTVLSRFRQDQDLIPVRIDLNLKRSSV